MTELERDEFLLWKAAQYEHPNFIETDPISIPHRCKHKEDIEIVGLIMASIAWGNRKAIIKSGEKLLAIFGESPYDFVMNFKLDTPVNFVHRTFSGDDLRSFIVALRGIYEKGGLQASFYKQPSEDHGMRIHHFRNAMLNHFNEPRVQKHISNPLANSACKRLNMFLRWMVRSNAKGVDFGLWNNIPKEDLRIPLDVHTGKTARSLGILQRKQNDWKSSEELYRHCSVISPEDPAKLDFALFGLGAFEQF
ncbi:MAG: TIGR02757 family protein [Bacteroidetes bacterium]|nr:TIGR02757 family protein [Bacteroidota bacterium]MBM3424448.1 TIGR02757 family protein [Bacteroidota bacterium]